MHKCNYCGSTSSTLVKKQSAFLKAKLSGLDIQPPCCGTCFQRIRHSKCTSVITPTHLALESSLKELRGKIGNLSKKSNINDIVRVMGAVYSVERLQVDLEREFKAKALEVQQLADKISSISSSLQNSKSQIGHLLSVSYENCRRIANAVISDKKIRTAVFDRDGGKCVKCGSSELLSVDHIKPVVKGGGNDLGNFQTLCLPCNLQKGSKYNPEINRTKVGALDYALRPRV